MQQKLYILEKERLIKALRIAQSIKATQIRDKSLQEYRNFIDRFEEYLKEKDMHDMFCEDFTQLHAIRYLDHILLTRKVGALTRNNYVRVLRALFYVLLERQYIYSNPFVGIKRLRETQKQRTAFTDGEKRIIIQHIKCQDPKLLLAVALCYYCAIRPTELRRLKVGNIQLKAGLITMDGTQTKNHELAAITIPTLLMPLLESHELHKYPQNWYLFGKETLKPAAQQCGRDTISKRHKKVVTDLHKYRFLSGDIVGKTFYSWKDTAARDLIGEGLNILELKDHFRHKEIKTTQRYLQMYAGVNPKIRDIKNNIL